MNRPGSPDLEKRLNQALQQLAEFSPKQAPEEVGTALRSAFRQHHSRRRHVRLRLVTALAACLIATVGIVFFNAASRLRPQEQNLAANSTIKTSPTQSVPLVAATQTVSKPGQAKTGTEPHQDSRQVKMSRDFIALPTYEQATPGEDLRIVRLRLAGSDLRRLGAPISENASELRWLADFVVGEDGTPYAVRLAQP